MKIDNLKLPKSSFLSIEKDINIIFNNILKNERLKRLLYYTTPDALEKKNLTQEESVGLFGTQILRVPRIRIDDLGNYKNFLVVKFDHFIQNQTNPEFKDNVIEFDIICHYDMWELKDLALRPYKIAAEIDSMFNKKKLTGIGLLEFAGGNFIPLNEDYAIFCMYYQAIHGGEDEVNIPNPNDQERFLKDFEEYINK